MNASLRKAAILVDSLDTATADVLYEQLSPGEADRVRQAVLSLEDIDETERRRVVAEFLREAGLAPAPARDNGIELAGALAQRNGGRYASTSSTAEPKQPTSSAARVLLAAPAAVLAEVLAAEHPQLAAVILAQMPLRVEAVFDHLPDESRADIARRIAGLRDPAPEVLAELQQQVAEQVSSRRAAPAAEPRRSAAAERTAAPAKQVTVAPSDWNFADLESLDDGALLVVLQQAPQRLVQQALAGAPETFLRRLTCKLPRAQAQAFRKHLTQVGRIRLDEIERAQQQLADLAARLSAEGYFRTTAQRRAA